MSLRLQICTVKEIDKHHDKMTWSLEAGTNILKMKTHKAVQIVQCNNIVP